MAFHAAGKIYSPSATFGPALIEEKERIAAAKNDRETTFKRGWQPMKVDPARKSSATFLENFKKATFGRTAFWKKNGDELAWESAPATAIKRSLTRKAYNVQEALMGPVPTNTSTEIYNGHWMRDGPKLGLSAEIREVLSNTFTDDFFQLDEQVQAEKIREYFRNDFPKHFSGPGEFGPSMKALTKTNVMVDHFTLVTQSLTFRMSEVVQHLFVNTPLLGKAVEVPGLHHLINKITGGDRGPVELRLLSNVMTVRLADTFGTSLVSLTDSAFMGLPSAPTSALFAAGSGAIGGICSSSYLFFAEQASKNAANRIVKEFARENPEYFAGNASLRHEKTQKIQKELKNVFCYMFHAYQRSHAYLNESKVYEFKQDSKAVLDSSDMQLRAWSSAHTNPGVKQSKKIYRRHLKREVTHRIAQMRLIWAGTHRLPGDNEKAPAGGLVACEPQREASDREVILKEIKKLLCRPVCGSGLHRQHDMLTLNEAMAVCGYKKNGVDRQFIDTIRSDMRNRLGDKEALPEPPAKPIESFITNKLQAVAKLGGKIVWNESRLTIGSEGSPVNNEKIATILQRLQEIALVIPDDNAQSHHVDKISGNELIGKQPATDLMIGSADQVNDPLAEEFQFKLPESSELFTRRRLENLIRSLSEQQTLHTLVAKPHTSNAEQTANIHSIAALLNANPAASPDELIRSAMAHAQSKSRFKKELQTAFVDAEYDKDALARLARTRESLESFYLQFKHMRDDDHAKVVPLWIASRNGRPTLQKVPLAEVVDRVRIIQKELGRALAIRAARQANAQKFVPHHLGEVDERMFDKRLGVVRRAMLKIPKHIENGVCKPLLIVSLNFGNLIHFFGTQGDRILKAVQEYALNILSLTHLHSLAPVKIKDQAVRALWTNGWRWFTQSNFALGKYMPRTESVAPIAGLPIKIFVMARASVINAATKGLAFAFGVPENLLRWMALLGTQQSAEMRSTLQERRAQRKVAIAANKLRQAHLNNLNTEFYKDSDSKDTLPFAHRDGHGNPIFKHHYIQQHLGPLKKQRSNANELMNED
jgi:hypothetical protein